MRSKSLTAASLLWASGLGSASAADEIRLDEVPENIRRVAEYYAPGTTFTAAGIEIESGLTIYELSGPLPNGRRIEIDIFANGELDEIEMEADVSDLPQAVLDAVGKIAPEGDIVFVETSVHGDGRFYYEVEVSLGGETRSFEIAENGDIVSSEGAASS
jgi:hypothetical protein